MEYRKAMKTLERMCRSYENCVKCPISTLLCVGGIEDCLSVAFWGADKVAPILGKWAKEHPEPEKRSGNDDVVLRDFMKKME